MREDFKARLRLHQVGERDRIALVRVSVALHDVNDRADETVRYRITLPVAQNKDQCVSLNSSVLRLFSCLFQSSVE